MEQGIQVLVATSLLVIGLSHLFQPHAWVAWYQRLAALGTSGAFAEGFLCLTFGTIVAGLHNVWHGPALVVTLLGWAQILKGAGRFLAPGVAVRVMARATPARAWYFRAGGVFALVVSGFVWWVRFRGVA